MEDAAWDVQEFLKKELESSTGYEVKAVNIHVQGVYFDDIQQKEPEPEAMLTRAALTTATE